VTSHRDIASTRQPTHSRPAPQPTPSPFRDDLVRWPIATPAHVSAISNVLHSSDWHYGSVHSRLESELHSYFARPVTTTSSCAWALYLALRVLQIEGLVAVPAFGYHGTVHPVLWNSCTPIFVDCDPATYNIDPNHLDVLLSKFNVSAVIAVHMHGLPVDQSIFDTCRRKDVPVIEDACQAFGAKVGERRVGVMGTCAALSFNSRKTLPAGLGGALVTANSDLSKHAADLTAYGGRDIDGCPTDIGYYLPMSEFDAALVLAQLPSVATWIANAQAYSEQLGRAIPDRCPVCPHGYTHAWHKYRIRGSEADRQSIEEAGIPTSRWGKRPLFSLSAYSDHSITSGSYPGTHDICANTFCIMNEDYPLHVQQGHVVNEIVHEIEKVLS